MKKYAVILAGGDGTRLWPLSRKSKPKQFLNLYGEESMIVETIKRVKDIVREENIFVVTSKNQEELMKKHVGKILKNENIIVEPEAKSTAASIGYAATKILEMYGDGMMCVFSSDHYIDGEDLFTKSVNDAISVGEKEDKIVCIGIEPTYPSINFGYIQIDNKEEKKAYDVKKFIEKPNKMKANQFMLSGDYLWNTGIMVSKISVILNSFKRLLPKYYAELEKIKKSINTKDMSVELKKAYSKFEKISISRAILEKEKNVKVVKGRFKWMDIGSLDTLSSLYKKDKNGNTKRGNVLNMNSKNCISLSNDRTIVTLGVEDLIIVETEDTVLVCNKKNAQDVKKLIPKIEKRIV